MIMPQLLLNSHQIKGESGLRACAFVVLMLPLVSRKSNSAFSSRVHHRHDLDD
jgi:hypothetical protein